MEKQIPHNKKPAYVAAIFKYPSFNDFWNTMDNSGKAHAICTIYSATATERCEAFIQVMS